MSDDVKAYATESEMDMAIAGGPDPKNHHMAWQRVLATARKGLKLGLPDCEECRHEKRIARCEAHGIVPGDLFDDQPKTFFVVGFGETLYTWKGFGFVELSPEEKAQWLTK